MRLWLILILGGIATSSGLRSLRVSYFQEILVGERVCDPGKHGAKGDGETDDTEALQKALDECGKAGGGQVLLSASHGNGIYLSKALDMSYSHLELNLPEGATLRISNDRKNWPSNKDFIVATKVGNVAITGAGTIDGQGQTWWENRQDFRPKTVKFEHVKHALISGITILDPPNHCLELYADHCEVAGVTVKAPPSRGVDIPSHNTDAVDIHGDPFYVHGCYFNTGDDNIAAHANNTLVENCKFGTGHGASIGSLCDVWLTNITFRNIEFDGTTAGARIKVHPNCAGRVWDVTYQDLSMHNVQTAIDVSMHYDSSSSTATQHQGFSIDHVTFKNINSQGQQYTGNFLCTSDQQCKSFTISNVTFDTHDWDCKSGNGCKCFEHATDFSVSGVKPDISRCVKPHSDQEAVYDKGDNYHHLQVQPTADSLLL